jgi:hypothetical protein
VLLQGGVKCPRLGQAWLVLEKRDFHLVSMDARWQVASTVVDEPAGNEDSRCKDLERATQPLSAFHLHKASQEKR